MTTLRRLLGIVSFALCALPATLLATPVIYDLSFQTSGQSIWDTGTSYQLDQTNFLGVAWQNKGVNIDLMAGDEDTDLINPLRLGYDAAFAACTGLGFSASACINGQSARVPVPALGSRPKVRSCGKWDVGCQIKRGADLTRRLAYDGAFATCRLSFSATVCRNGQSARLPVVALGTAPPQYLSIDTRTGVELSGTTDGRVGLEVGVKIDSGSVDATVSYQASLVIPDTTGLLAGTTISFNPDSMLAGVNKLDTTFSTVQLSVDAVMQLSGSVNAEACVIPAGCVAGSSPFNIDEKVPVLSFNEDGEGGIEVLGRAPSAFNLPIPDGFPVGFDIAGLADLTLYLPQPNASGGLDGSTNTLKASGQDDLVDLILDIDNIVATAAGVPGLFGGDLPSLKIGALEVGSFGYDIINVGMGPTIDLAQDFELDPTLWVTLEFDQEVDILGSLVTEFTSIWDLLPDITFLSDTTTVTPNFFVSASLLNQTLLDFDLNFLIDLLQITYDFPLLDIEGKIGIGNVLNESVDLFRSPDLYSKLFDLQGFNALQGDSFQIRFGAESSLPDTNLTRSLVNTIILAENPAEIPAAGTLLLLFGGFGGLFWVQRRSIHARRVARALDPARVA
jgi:hypothetical protein